MTLFRQLYSLLLGLFLLVISSLSYVQFTETKSFLTNQMESDLNNVSNALGLLLVPALESGDTATADTLINVIFEGGYYQQIKLTWLVDGKQKEWNNDLKIDNVPQWFIDLGLFGSINKETTITSGWLQLAKLQITAHPGYGYHELWRILTNTITVFAILFLIAILLARFGLSWILKPLHVVSEYAKQIANRHFEPELTLPKTAELKEVVQAFNSMSSQLKQMFNSLDEEVTVLRKKNLVDQVSNLPNRQYLIGRLNSWLSEPGSGGVFLAKLDWLEQVHAKYGYQVRDETIKLLAEKLLAQLEPLAPGVVARIAAYEFAILVQDADKELLSKYLQTFIRTLNQEITKAGGKANQDFAIGLTERVGTIATSDILAQADNALQTAIKSGRVYHWFESDEVSIYSREQWRTKLSDAISAKSFQFRWQPIQLCEGGGLLQRELYCQLEIGGKWIHAGHFMPYIELLSLGTLLDKCLIKDMYDKKLLARNYEPVAINLTHQSLTDPEFHQWLKHFLTSMPLANRICFDIPESGVYSNLDACEALCKIITDSGASFGIDHYGRQFGSMSYLQTLRPRYVKLDQSFAFYNENQHDDELCRALINVARGLEIDVIVTGIQENVQLEHFLPMKVAAYQGFIAPPETVS